MKSKNFYLSLALMAALLFTWPIPGTIALRNVVAGLLLASLIYPVWSRRSIANLTEFPALKLPVLLLMLLTTWIAFVIAGWSAEPALSWKEYWAQWIIPILCGASGFLVALQGGNKGPQGVQAVLKTVFYTLLLQVSLHDVLGAIYVASTGEQPFRQAPVLYLPIFIKVVQSGEPLSHAFIGQYFEKFSFINNTFAAILIAETLQRVIDKRRWLDVPNWLLGVSWLLVLLCSYWLRVRNGNLGLIFLIVVAGLMTLVRIRQRFQTRNLLIVIAAMIFGLVSVCATFWKSDARWQTFAETIPIALDTETNKAWLLNKTIPYPYLSNGSQVDVSNYERIAWIKEGLKLGWENPLGTGMNRNAFFDGLDRKYPSAGVVRGGHSHSGLVDFFIANGAPGLFLWLAFLLSLTLLGWRTFSGANMALGLMLIFLNSGFFSRSLVDSNIRDHVLQQFLFMVLLLATFCAAKLDPVQQSARVQ